MEAKQVPNISAMANMNTIEPSTPPKDRHRNSFTGWSDEAISILKKYPQNRDEYASNSRNRSRKVAGDSKTNLDAHRVGEASTRFTTPELRLSPEISALNKGSQGNLAHKRPGDKAIKKLDISNDCKPNEMSKIEDTSILIETGSSIEFYRRSPQLRNANDSKRVATKEGQNHHIPEFNLKLKPKQIPMKLADFQSLNIVFPESRPGRIVTKRRTGSPSTKDNSPCQNEKRRINEQLGHSRIREEKTRGLNEAHSFSKDANTSFYADRKKFIKLKSFNNANLRFQRKNYMGLSMLSNAPKGVNLGNKSFGQRPVQSFSPPLSMKMKEPLISRQYLEKISAADKNVISLSRGNREKQATLRLSFEIENDKDTTDREPANESIINYRIYNELAESKIIPKEQPQPKKSYLLGFVRYPSISKERTSESPMSASPKRRWNASFHVSMKRLLQEEEKILEL